MHLLASRSRGIRREHKFPGDAVDLFLGQPLLAAAMTTGCARSEQTKESNDFEE